MKLLTILIALLFSNHFLFSQSVEIKNSSDNLLIQINEEPGAGSITIPSITAGLSTPDNKLYNEKGLLFWNGSQLGTSGSAGGWTDDGPTVRLSTMSNNVGVGTVSPLSKLSVGGNGITEATIYGLTTNPDGYGVYGEASDITGGNFGGYFSAMGLKGIGVYGTTAGESGRGVIGITSNAIGANYGGWFSSKGNSGQGIYAYASDDTGVTYGVHGKVDSPIGWAGFFEGRGYFSGKVGIGITTPDEHLHVSGNIRLNGYFEDKDGQPGKPGQVLSSTGGNTDWIDIPGAHDAVTIGIPNGLSVSGQEISLALATDALAGAMSSADKSKIDGIPVGGGDSDWTVNVNDMYSTVSGNVGIGTSVPISKLQVGEIGNSLSTIFSRSSIPNGRAIHGVASDITGSNTGGYFVAEGITGRGVYGAAPHTSGMNFGGLFMTLSTSGYAVSGLALADTGVNYGVFGGTNSEDGWAGFFEGRGYFKGNVGIGTETPNSKLSIVGLSEYANNAAALAEGLVAGDLYRTSTGVLMVTY